MPADVTARTPVADGPPPSALSLWVKWFRRASAPRVAPPLSPAEAGREAERAAADALERAGWAVLARNVRTPSGEVDLVAERGGTIAFAEVKARRAGRGAGTADEALTPAKLRRVARAAEHVLRTRGLAGAPREFLGVAVALDDGGRPRDVRIVPVEEIP